MKGGEGAGLTTACRLRGGGRAGFNFITHLGSPPPAVSSAYFGRTKREGNSTSKEEGGRQLAIGGQLPKWEGDRYSCEIITDNNRDHRLTHPSTCVTHDLWALQK